jgi:hypothetical protein
MWPVLVDRIGLLRLALHKAAKPLVEMTALPLTPRHALKGMDEIGTGFGEGGHLTIPLCRHRTYWPDLLFSYDHNLMRDSLFHIPAYTT